MFRAYKTEIYPTKEQKIKINRTIGTCRWVYNFYIECNKKLYEEGGKFMNSTAFSKWLNNEYLPNNPDKSWVKDVSTKSTRKAMDDANRAYKRFFDGISGFPKFKKKSGNDVKMYFVKADAKNFIACERHRIKVPTLGWVRIKEKGYLPVKSVIRSGTISKRAGRYYVSVLIDEAANLKETGCGSKGIGIDLGIKDFAIISDGNIIRNVNRMSEIKKTEKKLRREQRSLSRKYEALKHSNKKSDEKLHPGSNIRRQIIRIQKLHQRIDNIRTDRLNKIIWNLVRTKPDFITIEDLNVSGMMKNRHLARSIAGQRFYEFKTKLEYKCELYNIELRHVDRFYPSSKLCNSCGFRKQDLKLKDRVFICDLCWYEADRDYNAALNLRDAKEYKIKERRSY